MDIKIKNFTSKNITKKYLSWLNDNELLKYSKHKNTFYTRNKAIKFYKKTLKAKNFFFSIKDKSKNKIIGTMIVYNKNRKANIGILIGDKNYHNKGYATMAIKLLYKKLKKKKFNYLELGCNKKNIQMIKVAKKLGFKKDTNTKNNLYFIKKI